jgi:hypothetical protein
VRFDWVGPFAFSRRQLDVIYRHGLPPFLLFYDIHRLAIDMLISIEALSFHR